MKNTKTPAGGDDANNEVPIIQLDPPVVFIRRRRGVFILRLIRKFIPGIFLKAKIRKMEPGGRYSKSRRVYFT